MKITVKRPNPWLMVFFISLAIELSAIWLNEPVIRHISKPLLMISLSAWFLIATAGIPLTLKRLITAALIFSWLGDLFLLLEEDVAVFFIVGLASFLVAHIFYIIWFVRLHLLVNTRLRLLWILPLLAYYAALLWVLGSLGSLEWPVRVYGLAIVTMLFMALQCLYLHSKTGGSSMLAGALLFVISDTMLAIDKFHTPFAGAGLLIMLTYAAAQFFIVMGATAFLEHKAGVVKGHELNLPINS